MMSAAIPFDQRRQGLHRGVRTQAHKRGLGMSRPCGEDLVWRLQRKMIVKLRD